MNKNILPCLENFGGRSNGSGVRSGGSSYSGGGVRGGYDGKRGDHRDEGERRPHPEYQSTGYTYGGGGRWGWDYPYYINTYPLFVEETPIVVETNYSPSVVTDESMSNQTIDDNYAKIAFPTEWKNQTWFKSNNPTCSLIQARWKNKEEISSDPTCVCPVGNKV